MNKLPFILASGSPRRKELLSSLGINFQVMIPIIDEVELPFETPLDSVRRLSREKAQSVAFEVDFHECIILSADTIVSFPSHEDPSTDMILSKPIDEIHAWEILSLLRSQSHKVTTGVTLLVMGGSPQQITKAVTTEVVMRAYTDEEIDEYIKTGNPFDKAGGYAIQDKIFNPVDNIIGSYTNVVGLPTELVLELLSEIGYHISLDLDSLRGDNF